MAAHGAIKMKSKLPPPPPPPPPKRYVKDPGGGNALIFVPIMILIYMFLLFN